MKKTFDSGVFRPGRIVAYAVTFFLVSAALFAAVIVPSFFSVKVRARVTPSRIFLGDTVRYSLSATVPPGALLEIPDIEKEVPGLRFTGSSRRERRRFGGRRRIRKNFFFLAAEPGPAHIPGFELRYKKHPEGEWKTRTLPGEDISVRRLADIPDAAPAIIGVTGDIADIPSRRGDIMPAGPGTVDAPIRLRIDDSLETKPVRTSRDRILTGLYFVLGLAVFFLAAILALGIFWYSREKVPPTPLEKAMADLARLEKMKLTEKGLYQDLCAGLYSIITVYIRARFEIPGEIMTAGEFVEKLKVLRDIPEETKQYVAEKIILYDTVKYSGNLPENTNLDSSLSEVRDFIRSLSPENENEEETAR